MRKLFPFLTLILGFCWFVWSFILTDASLLYSKTTLFVRVQTWLWQFAPNRLLVTGLYGVLLLLFWGLYIFINRWVRQQTAIKPRAFLLPFGLLLLFFVLSNPALSYDLFNYLFDAKLVIQYHLDPHVTSAYAFSGKDDWVRFMRNVFFPTTYGYMWTALSLVPFVVGFGKLLTVFVAFKVWMLAAYTGLFLLAKKIWQRTQQSQQDRWPRLALFLCSPLVLIETLSSGHNDLWMMLFAFLSLFLLMPDGFIQHSKQMTMKQSGKVATIFRILVSFGLLYASSEIKRSTALLLPVWGMLAVGLVLPFIPVSKQTQKGYQWLKQWWADGSALLLLGPLVTTLSRQFHPWYLLWALSFLPFVKSKLLRMVLIGLSITSTVRYIPILYVNIYSEDLERIQKMITWSAIPVVLVVWIATVLLQSRKRKRT